MIYVTGGGAFGVVTVIEGATNDAFSLEAGNQPSAVAVNVVTNKIYVANLNDNWVAVVDGASFDTDTVPTDSGPAAVAVNPVTNKIYFAMTPANGSNIVTVIDGATNATTRVAVDSYPRAVAVNPVTNKIYVACWKGVTVIDGATNATTLVRVGPRPSYAVAVNPVTNKIYVACGNRMVTVIDGATNGTTWVDVDNSPNTLVVNPVTNKVYGSSGGGALIVIDGATNATTSIADVGGGAVAVNPVTSKVYVAGGLTVITDASANDTRVRAKFDRLPGDTTSLARPSLTGKGVNRSTPGRTAMMGVGNRMNTSQTAWDWSTITSGAGTDSVTWSYNWGADTLVLGENFVCCVPFEDQAATSNSLGLGSPFAGNLGVYPVYRIGLAGGVEETPTAEVRPAKAGPTVVGGVLVLGEVDSRQNAVDRTELLDVSGRKVMELQPGANDVRDLAPGVYFVRSWPSAVSRKPSAVTKVVIAR